MQEITNTMKHKVLNKCRYFPTNNDRICSDTKNIIYFFISVPTISQVYLT